MTMGYGTGAPQFFFFLTQTVVSKGKVFFIWSERERERTWILPFFLGCFLAKELHILGSTKSITYIFVSVEVPSFPEFKSIRGPIIREFKFLVFSYAILPTKQVQALLRGIREDRWNRKHLSSAMRILKF